MWRERRRQRENGKKNSFTSRCSALSLADPACLQPRTWSGFIRKKLLIYCLSLLLPLQLTSFCRTNFLTLFWRTIQKRICIFCYLMSDVKHYGKRVWEHCSTKWPIFYKAPQTDGGGDLTNTKFKKKFYKKKQKGKQSADFRRPWI